MTVLRGQRTPKPPPTPEELRELERLTDGLPEDLRQYRDRGLLNRTRRFRIEQALKHRTRSIVPLLEGVHDPHNQAAVMRTAEALGLQEVHFIDTDDQPFAPSPRVTQNAHRWLDLSRHSDLDSAVAALHERGYQVWAAGFTADARPIHQLPIEQPLGLLFGNESLGVTEVAHSLCDGWFIIPLQGFSQSLNVSVAAAVALWWAVDARKSRLGSLGDLTAEDTMTLRRRFYRQAVGLRGRSEAQSAGEPSETEGHSQGLGRAAGSQRRTFHR